MKAVLLDDFGGPDVLYVGEAEKPAPKDNQVLIKVKATSINGPDVAQREGKYPPPPGESEILGVEVAGVIEEVGSNVKGWNIGDNVMTLVGGGGYAEYAVAYANHLIKIPENLSFEEAACICESYITAYSNVFMFGKLQDNQYAILHGGGGGVNTAAIQICKALVPNTKLIVTSPPEKMEKIKELGVDLVINYKETPDFSKMVKEYTNKRGVDVILDCIGAAYLEPNIKSLTYTGRLVVIGVLSGIKAELNLALLMVKRQQIIGSVLRSRPIEEKAEIVKSFTDNVIPKVADGSVKPIIHKIFSIDDVAKAHKTMAEDTHFGKIVMKISD
ncbi:NAD(P)H quinone oxidoreductase, PIG3 family [Flexistipes sinusarabici DSM 4947]|uniref:NAD(P)H quinone oxidoreductase, PIG3 family n=1 Tax=Flexistipes sinusarabici (strain ATCC 49648 / DSM 4947 / MAS 10) TaxID=717231 RepID=F8E8R4_FLESM|nr:NAD(P)H-quinone oxidoreductase [Flexistipes sinusarabici]AEI15187.1 NAD(P)H quinone oxidoreductase, PIG3 family [Flexistipes sinusarabici DSM 4947]